MKEYPKEVKEKLTSLINEMAEKQWRFVKNPVKDFIRNRKLPFEKMMQLLISMGGNSIYKELLESQGYDVNTATTSAFVQQRDKILPYAFEFLLNKFTKSCSGTKKHKGYRLFAVDGSDFNITRNPSDKETYFHPKVDAKGYNLLHMNAVYDLCNRLYIDVNVQPGRLANEHKALVEMVDRSDIKDNVIIIADRNYESYNNFAHIEQRGWNYAIRVKDLGGSGILFGLSLPSCSEFDVRVRRILTKKRTKEVKATPEIYRWLAHKVNFDFLDMRENSFYPMSFRVVRFKIADNSYETIITNLDALEFPPDEIKKLYAMSWGIETSFRELKYTIGLVNFHAKKQEFVIQEIFERVIMYNFA